MTEIDSTSKVLTEFTYDDFPCHLKVNRNKLVLINIIVDGSVKRAKDCRQPLTHSRKQINSTDSARYSGPYEEVLPTPGTNQISGFIKFHPLTS